MGVIAGISFPCTECKQRIKQCKCQIDVYKQVFFKIGRRCTLPIECEEFEQMFYHGVEGVRL